ncbi:MAG: AzlC family ABC transporter permease [Synergistales bacterium]
MRGEFTRGARAAVPVSLGIVAYALVFGVLVAGKGIGVGTLAFMNLAVFSGSAQFVLVGMWQAGLPVWQMALAAAVVNVRYFLLTAAIAPMMEPYGWFGRAWRVHFVTDENWAVTMAENRRAAVGANFLLGGGVLVMAAWSLGTLAGHGLGITIRHPERFGMDFAFTAIFTALAVTMWRGRGDILPWAVSAGTALLARRMLPGAWYVLLGGLAGAMTAALMGKRDSA